MIVDLTLHARGRVGAIEFGVPRLSLGVDSAVVMGGLFLAVAPRLSARSNSGIVQGTITDPSGGAVPGAKVRVENPISGHVNEVE